MANILFTEYKNSILGSATHAVPDMDTDTIKAALTDEQTTAVVPGTHVDYAEISAMTVDTPATMANGAISGGSIDYDDFLFTSVSGNSCESLNWYMDRTTEANSPLILHVDTATGLPVTPNGGNINVTLDASGLFTF